MLYVAVSLFTGAITGLAAGKTVRHLEAILKTHGGKDVSHTAEKDHPVGHLDPGSSCSSNSNRSWKKERGRTGRLKILTK